jgi:carbonic anhydrase
VKEFAMYDLSSLSRRRVLFSGGAAFSLSMLGVGKAWAASDAAPGPNAIPPDEALARLMDGNARYAANHPNNKDFSVGRAARAKAQYPIAAILGCADSRVAPELIFDQGLGDLFVVRVAGNFVNDDGLASLEYGAKFLGVPLIMVLGHSNCGAVAATIKVVKEKAELPGHLPELVDAIRPAVVAAALHPTDNLLAAATAENVRMNVAHLSSGDALIAKLVADGKVKVVGAVYEIQTGRVGLV